VVARVIAEASQHLCGERGACTAVAVDDDLARPADALSHLLGRQPRQLLHVDVGRAGDVSLPRVAVVPRGAAVLLARADVEHAYLAEAPRELVELDLAHSAATTSSSRANDGRSARVSSHSARCGGSSTPSMSRARITHGAYAMSANSDWPTSSSRRSEEHTSER